MAESRRYPVTDLDDLPCTCPRGMRSLGRLHGINLGRGILRIATTPGCPRHDSCRGFTASYRASVADGHLLYCPIHPRYPGSCPEPATHSGEAHHGS